jgi:glycosyltransferase involved in cell wall biosynthesis
MKISIALCTYNGAKYLQAQLESIALQTRPPDELIVCDDCSIDDTKSILESFSKASPFPVRLFYNKKNLGTLKNFERAIAECDGDIIALSDQDDVWMPEKLKCFETVFTSHPNVGLVFSDAELTNENLQPLDLKLWDLAFNAKDQQTFKSGNPLDILLEYNVVTGATMAFRSSFRPFCLPIPASLSSTTDIIHDGWISIIIAAFAELYFIDELLIKYRQHPGQQLGPPNLPFEKQARDPIGDLTVRLQRLSELKKFLAPKKLLESTNKAFTEEYETKHSRLISKIDEHIDYFQSLLEHFKARRALPQSKTRRIVPIIRELYTHRYHRYSKGFLSALKDLLG